MPIVDLGAWAAVQAHSDRCGPEDTMQGFEDRLRANAALAQGAGVEVPVHESLRHDQGGRGSVTAATSTGVFGTTPKARGRSMRLSRQLLAARPGQERFRRLPVGRPLGKTSRVDRCLGTADGGG